VTVDLDARLTGAQAARLARVSPQLIRRWVQLGHLERGNDGLYRTGDVLVAECVTRRSTKSRRVLRLT
jgi:hypothetical protein